MTAHAEASALSSWRSSWRVAMRMARREVARHRGRSAVVALMVGLPVALLILAATEGSGLYWVSASATVTRTMGQGAAVIDSVHEFAVISDGAGNSSTGSDEAPAQDIAGYDPAASGEANAAAIASIFGPKATAIAVSSTDSRVRIDGLNRTVPTLITTQAAELEGKLTLLTGRWPQNDAEIVVTRAGVAHGLPSDGTVTARTAGGERTLAITGTADAWVDGYSRAGIVATAPVNPETYLSQQWIILRAAPVTLSEVTAAGSYGLSVRSAELIRHPVDEADLPVDLRSEGMGEDAQTRNLMVISATVLVIVIGLLVAPAFAVSAARQRRTLALAACNGATTRQLRHTVLAQAVILGVSAALAGAGLGVVGAAALAWLSSRPTQYYPGGELAISVPLVAGVVACAVFAAIAAALIPARRLGRLDVVGVMKGQSVSPPVSRLAPLVGLALLGVGSLVLLRAITSGPAQSQDLQIVVGLVALVFGALGLVPMILVAGGRLARSLPVPMRMAARDAARQRTRSVPAVAAIIGGVAALTTIGIAVSSDARQNELEYTTSNATGQGLISGYQIPDGEWSQLTAQIKSVVPSLQTYPVQNLTDDPWIQMTEGSGEIALSFLVAVPGGCTAERALDDAEYYAASVDEPGPATVSPCKRLGPGGSMYSAIGALDAEVLVRRFGLSGRDAQIVRDGGAVVADASALDNHRLTLTAGTAQLSESEGSYSEVTTTSTVHLDAVVVPITKSTTGLYFGQFGALLPSATAAANSWFSQTIGVLAINPDGAITPQQEDAISTQLGDDFHLSVERGYEDAAGWAMAILVGIFAFLLLVVTLTSTALSLAEQQSEDATLAAVGATRGTRRWMAAAQSLLICGVGAALGLVVGFVPGYAFTIPLTSQTWDPITGDMTYGDPIVVVPWVWLSVVAIAVPLISAALSWASIRRAPVVTRRAA